MECIIFNIYIYTRVNSDRHTTKFGNIGQYMLTILDRKSTLKLDYVIISSFELDLVNSQGHRFDILTGGELRTFPSGQLVLRPAN